jgi:hypothetical protein
VIGCAISVLLKLLAGSFTEWRAAFNLAATILILGLVTSMSLYIFIKFVRGVRAELAEKHGVAKVGSR